MRLGGTVVGEWTTLSEWEALLRKSRFRAITAPFDCRTPREDIGRFMSVCLRNDVVVAEVGVWKNPFDPDPEAARAATQYAVKQLALADEWNIPCCVNIAGTASAAGWDAADASNFAPETYERIVASIRAIIDAAQPRRAYYCIEPMPWMIPDGPEVYEKLIRDVGRRQFAAHMDFVNMINCPRRYLGAETFIGACFEALAPYIKSTHIKDIRLHPTRLTTILEECAPGEGGLDFEAVLRVIDRWLPDDAPVLLEHMETAAQYRAAYDYVAAVAAKIGIRI